MDLLPGWALFLLHKGALGLAQPRVWDGLMLQRQLERPTLADRPQPDDLRVGLAWGALLGAHLVLLPWRDALGWGA